MARSFAAQIGYASVDLSPYKMVTFSFWLNWPSFSNDGAMCLEYTDSVATNAGAFYLSPNYSTGNMGLWLGAAAGVGQGGEYNRSDLPTGKWNHVFIQTDRVNSDWNFCVNGVRLSGVSGYGTNALNSTWANNYLYIMNRGGSTLKATGKMAHLAIWGHNPREGVLSSKYGIARLLANGMNPLVFDPANLVAYWPMDDYLPYPTAGYGWSANVAPKQRPGLLYAGDLSAQATVEPNVGFYVAPPPVVPLPLVKIPGRERRAHFVRTATRQLLGTSWFSGANTTYFNMGSGGAASITGSQMTAIAWISPGVTTGATYRTIFGVLGLSQESFALGFNSAGNLDGIISDNTGRDEATAFTPPGNYPPFYMVGLVKDGGTAYLWYDKNYTSFGSGRSIAATTSDFRLGRNMYGDATVYNGYMSHVTLWNVALRVDEMYALARGKHPMSVRQGNLRVHYPLGPYQGQDMMARNSGSVNGTTLGPWTWDNYGVESPDYEMYGGADLQFLPFVIPTVGDYY